MFPSARSLPHTPQFNSVFAMQPAIFAKRLWKELACLLIFQLYPGLSMYKSDNNLQDVRHYLI